jgi:hypothetical protein
VTSFTVYDITFDLARHKLQRTFFVLRDLRAANQVLGIPWLDDEHAYLQFGTTRVFTLMDGTTMETYVKERRHECLLMSYGKIQKLMRKTRRSEGRNAEFYVFDISPAAEQPAEFHDGEKLISKYRENFMSLLYDGFPGLMEPVDSPHVSRQWDHPIDTTSPMKRQRAECAKLNRHLKDALEASLIRPIHREFGSPILLVRKNDGSLRLCIVYGDLNGVTRKDAYPLPHVDDTLDELKDANFYTHLDLASGFWQV